ncbi:hypothetical protein QAD02_005415 [Eretmocerus hayati]|uniref:Uncharacterized protein n=1 Tax=Eretmocerus hayati TaxID=131215 RepID=A0ACC2NSG7_9HYME|nr:hypothetical protein QAD02_005415 [Eretmocerus hayati]
MTASSTGPSRGRSIYFLAPASVLSWFWHWCQHPNHQCRHSNITFSHGNTFSETDTQVSASGTSHTSCLSQDSNHSTWRSSLCNANSRRWALQPRSVDVPPYKQGNLNERSTPIDLDSYIAGISKLHASKERKDKNVKINKIWFSYSEQTRFIDTFWGKPRSNGMCVFDHTKLKKRSHNKPRVHYRTVHLFNDAGHSFGHFTSLTSSARLCTVVQRGHPKDVKRTSKFGQAIKEKVQAEEVLEWAEVKTICDRICKITIPRAEDDEVRKQALKESHISSSDDVNEVHSIMRSQTFRDQVRVMLTQYPEYFACSVEEVVSARFFFLVSEVLGFIPDEIPRSALVNGPAKEADNTSEELPEIGLDLENSHFTKPYQIVCQLLRHNAQWNSQSDARYFMTTLVAALCSLLGRSILYADPARAFKFKNKCRTKSKIIDEPGSE